MKRGGNTMAMTVMQHRAKDYGALRKVYDEVAPKSTLGTWAAGQPPAEDHSGAVREVLR
jgi:hypothetical protein